MSTDTQANVALDGSKKARWSLDKDTGISTVVLPSALTGSYDLNELPGVDWSAVEADTTKMVMFYGHKQKLSDSVARTADAKLTDQERLDVMQMVHERLSEDSWNAARMTADDLAAIRLRQCQDDSEMDLLARLQIVTTEQVAKEQLRREALA
ncbi:MAG: hypothetical protein ACXAEN_26450 [Candidatus Thorarchaeota archaeon]|jgi:hypothetical protein